MKYVKCHIIQNLVTFHMTVLNMCVVRSMFRRPERTHTCAVHTVLSVTVNPVSLSIAQCRIFSVIFLFHSKC